MNVMAGINVPGVLGWNGARMGIHSVIEDFQAECCSGCSISS